MSPKLKPLLLPQMVEDKRKLELLQQLQQQQQIQQPHQQYPYAPSDVDPSFMYSSHTSSSSDLHSQSPGASAFSRSQLRYSGSCSSLEMISSPTMEIPTSPAPPAHPSKNLSHLPDVQEDPSEREDDVAMVADHEVAEFGLYDCLCELARYCRCCGLSFTDVRGPIL